MTAFEYKFKSMEADIFLVDTMLLVAHDLEKTTPQRTLQSLYLNPIKNIIKLNGGNLVKSGEELFLLVDFKSEGENTYKRLKEILKEYKNILTRVENGDEIQGQLKIILSGSYPFETVKNENTRLVFIDGRPEHVGKGFNKTLMPLISENWFKLPDLFDEFKSPEEKKAELKNFINQIHQEKKIVRFWAAPDNEMSWFYQMQLGVDLINTDKIPEFSNFLKKEAENN